MHSIKKAEPTDWQGVQQLIINQQNRGPNPPAPPLSLHHRSIDWTPYIAAFRAAVPDGMRGRAFVLDGDLELRLSFEGREAQRGINQHVHDDGFPMSDEAYILHWVDSMVEELTKPQLVHSREVVIGVDLAKGADSAIVTFRGNTIQYVETLDGEPVKPPAPPTFTIGDCVAFTLPQQPESVGIVRELEWRGGRQYLFVQTDAAAEGAYSSAGVFADQCRVASIRTIAWAKPPAPPPVPQPKFKVGDSVRATLDGKHSGENRGRLVCGVIKDIFPDDGHGVGYEVKEDGGPSLGWFVYEGEISEAIPPEGDPPRTFMVGDEVELVWFDPPATHRGFVFRVVGCELFVNSGGRTLCSGQRAVDQGAGGDSPMAS